MLEITFERAFNVLVIASILSLFVERALDTLFDWRLFKSKLEGKGLKVPIAVITSYFVCIIAGFDVMVALGASETTQAGYIISSFFLAGGSKGMAKTWGRMKEIKGKARV